MVKRKYLNYLLITIFLTTIFHLCSTNANPWLPKPRQYSIYGLYNLTSNATIKKQKDHRVYLEEIKNLIMDVKALYLKELFHVENTEYIYYQKHLQKQQIKSIKSAIGSLDYIFYYPQNASLGLMRLIKFNLANNLLKYSSHIPKEDKLVCSQFFNLLNIELLKILTLYPWYNPSDYNSLTIEYGVNSKLSIGINSFIKNHPENLSQNKYHKDLNFFIKHKIYEDKKSIVTAQAKAVLVNLHKSHLSQEYSMLLGRTSFFKRLKFVHSTEFSVGFPRKELSKASYSKRVFTESVEWKKFTFILQNCNYKYKIGKQTVSIQSQQFSLAKLLSINNFEFTGQVGYFVEKQAKKTFRLADGVFFSIWIK